MTATSRSSVSASGGTATVVVAAQPECAWSASAEASWITEIKPTSGQGDGQIEVAVAPNPATAPRQSSVRVNSAAAAISQEAAACQFGLSATTLPMPAAGGTTSIDVTTTANCAWTAASSVPWMTVGTPSATGSGSVVVQVAANSGVARSGTITVSNQTVTVDQAAVSPTPSPSPPGGACSYAINPLSQTLAASGGNGGPVSVTTTSACPWTATTTASWITVTSGATGMGTGTVSFTVAPNSGGARSDTLIIAGQLFTVNQDGAKTSCSYGIAPTSGSIGASGGPGSPIAVTAGANCSWTAASNASWITITSAASGTGNGSVTFAVAANSGPVRTGTLTVGGQTFTVNQAAGCLYAIAPTNETFSDIGGTGAVAVTAPAGCSWTAVSNDAWVTIISGASGSGNGSVGFLVALNPSNRNRSGTLTVAGQLFTVSQRKN